MRATPAQGDFTASSAVLMPNSVPPVSNNLFDSVHNDFIRHPEHFPLTYRRTGLWQRRMSGAAHDVTGDLGLSFRSRKHIPIGTDMEISIPLRGDIQKFRGSVVLVREIEDGYEIGLWLATEDDASRARIVEQICYIECYLKEKRRRGGHAAPRQATHAWPADLGPRTSN